MKLETIKNGAISALSKGKLSLAANAPEILLGVGTLLIMSATYMACNPKTVDKAHGIVDWAQTENDVLDEAHQIEPENFTEEEVQAGKKYVAMKTAAKYFKLYAPAGVTMIAGFACIFGGHHILKSRYSAIVSAYNILSTGFADYRKRVVEEHGAEADYMYKNNIYKETVEKEVTNEETGEKETVKEEKMVMRNIPNDPFFRVFDELSAFYKRDAMLNRHFLTTVQARMNDRLRVDGYLFLSDVLRAIDLPISGYTQIMGWIYDPNDLEGVDFGLNNILNREVVHSINGYEDYVPLNFNCQKLPIYEKI